MPNFSVDQIREIMDKTTNIRSMSVIAHVDHGKSTLTDSLVCKAGIISAKMAGDARYTDTRADEQERGVTIKSTGVSLYFEYAPDDVNTESFLINLVDSPGHVDFSSEVTAALRITDGALVVIDCVEGCAVQTETVLRQSLAERVRPVLFVNKVDRMILELKSEGEEMYRNFRKGIEDVNVIVATYSEEMMGDLQVGPEKGTVAFGSGLHGWGFNVERFAKIYSAKFKTEKQKMMLRLWGDQFFVAKRKVWTNKLQNDDGDVNRAFVQFIMEPIRSLMMAVMEDNAETYNKMWTQLGINLTAEEKELEPKKKMKRTMQIWINAADTLLQMIVSKLPSPVVAQKYRVHNLYEGPIDDDAGKAISTCDKSAGLMMYVSKMVPTNDKGRFYAFGRVFSGTVATGQKVRIQGPRYVPGGREDLSVKNIQRTVLMMGRVVEQVPDVPCGNTVALVGIDAYLVKSGTLTTFDNAYIIADMKYSVSPVVKVSVKCKDAKDLPKLVDGLKKLSKSDPLVVCSTEETGEHIVAGCGELHVEICLKDLEEEYAQCPLIVGDPVVTYKETVRGESSMMCLSKSPNKHNRLYFKAEPLAEELANKIEAEKDVYGPKADPKTRIGKYFEEFEWDKTHASKIWCWGPETEGANVVVDVTQGVQYLAEIKEHVVSGFQWCSKNGPLAEEQLRGTRFNLHDVTLHTDSIHRGAGQIMPTARRVCFASMLKGDPTLQEPVFLVEITCPNDAMSGVYSTMNARRGIIFQENPREGTPLMQVKAHLPVSESFGFVAVLRQATSGQAFPQCVFDHWENLESGAWDQEDSKLQKLCLAIRKRKNIKIEMPKFDEYYDKL